MYFQSIYFHDPSGTILEPATCKRMFDVDEEIESMTTWLAPIPEITPDMHLGEATRVARSYTDRPSYCTLRGCRMTALRQAPRCDRRTFEVGTLG
ncbi:MAG: hypothetical protein M1281_18255 [Chloroflexi bacterium]|nr:hypothetical protein [Chloroflexota bacterium]